MQLVTYWQGIQISLRPKSTNEPQVQCERDSTITHPRSSEIQDLNGHVGDSDGERIRYRSDASENQVSDHSRSSSSIKSQSFKWFSNVVSDSSDEEEDEGVKFRKGNNYRTLHNLDREKWFNISLI